MSGGSSFASNSGKLKRKRNRIPLSCTICRKRKVKCDKSRPHCEQCVKTGVAHLCHYMEQSWAEEAEKEISKEAELKQLRERVKSLEESLSKVHSVCSHTPDSNVLVLDNNNDICNDDSKLLSGQNKYNNDELDLTRQFDMLHLKNNGTIHLGATHWLAIMKGDPYLKLLWGHIFSMREKLAEWYSQKRKNPRQKGLGKPGTSNSKCPIDHSGIGVSSYRLEDTPSPLQTLPSKCPVDHAAMSKCPVSHAGNIKMEPEAALPRPPSLPSFQNLASRCPVIHTDPSANFKEPQMTQPQMVPLQTGNRIKSLDQVLARIIELLPPKRIIVLFMEKFFKQIYPVIPIIDEQNFKNHMNHILTLRSSADESDKVQKLRMTKLSDYCNMGILVIILRLTWLSLPSNACEIDLGSHCSSFLMPHLNTATVTQAKEETLLIKYETPVEALELIREHLIKFDQISSISNSNVNLTTVQFAIFYKLYLMCWANDNPSHNTASDPLVPGTTNNGGGQDNETHQVLLSSITQMAFSCGLHRDPDNFPQLNAVSHGNTENPSKVSVGNGNPANTSAKMSKEAQTSTERFKHTWRKTWYYIVSLDVQQSLSLGTPRLLRNLRDFSDTKLPSASKIDYVRDIKELVIVKNTTLFFQIDLCIIAVLNHILNVSLAKNVRKFELDSLISSLSDLTHGKRNICDVVTSLINRGLLHTAEGMVDQNTDEVYGLPSLEEILSQQFSSSSEIDVDKKLDLAHESATRALFFSKHLTLRMLLYLLNYILFTHYEPMAVEDPGTTAIAKEYAQETLNYAMDGYRNCMLFFNNLKNAGSMSSMFSYMEVLLAPQCLDIGHRALQFIVCLILRAKCGPLTGMGEGAIVNSNAGSSSSEDEHEVSTAKKESSVELTDDVAKDISLDAGESLAETLLERMALFHKMTKQMCVKYHYATRIMKSTGFFLALLKHPNAKLKNERKSGQDHGKKPVFSNFLKNVPSLILSADGEQLKRCPVYQDAVGFVTPRTPSNIGQTTFPHGNTRFGAQLPLLRSYKPITYTSSNMRRTGELEDNEQKRRRLDTEQRVEPLKLAELVPAALPPMQPISPPAMTPNGMVSGLAAPLPSLGRIAGQFTPLQVQNENTTYVANGNGLGVPKDTANGGVVTFTSPVSDTSSSVNYTPAFEDFLLQNSNFNGIMINPSSIVEAVGFHNFDSTDLPIGNEAVDFLPIDNAAIDGLSELTGTEFPAWE
ncbi:hypothetical protein HG537_0D02120 [Torulaspora globosa]|uniref:Zn(2)-C6 fungal-type domain-containing protein n=1 Tax=Torulaspora globosa TaxID=48254 RepID=A0A7H9HSC5_9SACH|nr:hypothetical protein HG537_0D02120 [Torulaspora sp. CBS 2947]